MSLKQRLDVEVYRFQRMFVRRPILIVTHPDTWKQFCEENISLPNIAIEFNYFIEPKKFVLK